MREALLIGTVRGLAVALGIGAAATGGTGIAWAQPQDSRSSQDSTTAASVKTDSATSPKQRASRGPTNATRTAPSRTRPVAAQRNPTQAMPDTMKPTATVNAAAAGPTLPIEVGAVPALVPYSTPGTDPLVPAESALTWSLAAAARRELGRVSAGASAASTKTASQTAVPATGTTSNPVVTKTITVGSGAAAIAASPDGRFVYVANTQDNSVSVINAATNTVSATIALPAKSSPRGIAVSPDGKTVYVANTGTGLMSIINATNNTVTGSVKVGLNPSGVLVSPDGAAVYVNNAGGGSAYRPSTVSVINAATNTVTKTIFPQLPILSLAVAGFSPDAKTTYVINSFNDVQTVNPPFQVGILNTATNAITRTVTIAYGRIGGVAVNPVTGEIYAGIQVNLGYPPALVIVDPTSMTLTARIQTPFAQKGSLFPPSGVAVSADGKSVFVTNVNDNSVSVINPATKTVTATVRVGQGPRGIAVVSGTGNAYVTNSGLGTGKTISVIRTA